MAKSHTIVIVEHDSDRTNTVINGLRESGDHRINVLSNEKGVARAIMQLSPDLVVIIAAKPSLGTIIQLALACGPTDRPVVVFVDQSDMATTRAAIDAGVSAFVIDGLHCNRIIAVLETAFARFQLLQRMRSELETTKRRLEERKTIDRAKGLIMKARDLTEEESYALLRKSAMDQGKRVADIAFALVATADLLS